MLIEVVPDAKWPGMWRARKADGTLTDMVNLTRAKDAAQSIALMALNGAQKTSDRDGGKDFSLRRNLLRCTDWQDCPVHETGPKTGHPFGGPGLHRCLWFATIDLRAGPTGVSLAKCKSHSRHYET
jgi:hypothetical protein